MKKILILLLILGPFYCSAQKEIGFLRDYVILYEDQIFEVSKEYLRNRNIIGRNPDIVPNLFKVDLVKEKKGIKRIENTVELEPLMYDSFKVVSVDYQLQKELMYEYNEISLVNLRTDEKYIFKYNPKAYYDFPFSLKKELTFIDDFFCNEINVEKDKFTGDVRRGSRLGEDVNFKSIIKDGDIFNFIGLQVSSRISDGAKGGKVYILFDDESKIEFDNIDVDVSYINSSINYMYYVNIPINKNHIDQFKSKKIEAFRIVFQDKELRPFDSVRFMHLARCVFN